MKGQRKGQKPGIFKEDKDKDQGEEPITITPEETDAGKKKDDTVTVTPKDVDDAAKKAQAEAEEKARQKQLEAEKAEKEAEKVKKAEEATKKAREEAEAQQRAQEEADRKALAEAKEQRRQEKEREAEQKRRKRFNWGALVVGIILILLVVFGTLLVSHYYLKGREKAATVVSKTRPVVTIPDQPMEKGRSLSIPLDGYVTDLDTPDDQITWNIEGNAQLSVGLDRNLRFVTVAPLNSEWTGSETLTFTAQDPGGLTGSDTATFTIIAPVVTEPRGGGGGGGQPGQPGTGGTRLDNINELIKRSKERQGTQ